MAARYLYVCFFLLASFALNAKVKLGVDIFFEEEIWEEYRGKNVALLTNQTGVAGDLSPTFDLIEKKAPQWNFKAVFTPEHGLNGSIAAGKEIEDHHSSSLPIFSLYGKNRRPTEEMLKGIDVIFCDIQDIGSRSYTFISTLFYVIEEAAKREIAIVVFDRPNPMGGLIVDGPLLEKDYRSILGYIDVPYCHGMTMGELADYFNQEYAIGCNLRVIKMQGWKRSMTFKETGLHWIPTSPNIPEHDTPFFYASTGILGELSIVNIGIGYTQPFKIVGAPWINGKLLAQKLNAQHFPGVVFFPIAYHPLFGLYKDEECYGIKIFITDPSLYKPVQVQYMIIGMLKSLFPKEFNKRLSQVEDKKRRMFHQVNGTDAIWDLMTVERYPAWKMVEYDKESRAQFLNKRKQYLLY